MLNSSENLTPIMLPNANELHQVADKAQADTCQQWLEDVKREVIEAARAGNYCLTVWGTSQRDINDLKSIFEPLGYSVKENHTIVDGLLVDIEW